MTTQIPSTSDRNGTELSLRKKERRPLNRSLFDGTRKETTDSEVPMFGLREYAIISRGGCWPSGECLVLDPASGGTVAVVREEPWPEVFYRPWPDGDKGRPWLLRLIAGTPRYQQSRTVVRRYDDGLPLVRLHRQPGWLTRPGTCNGVSDHEDHLMAYSRGAIQAPGDEFQIVRLDDLWNVRRTATCVYRVDCIDDGMADPAWGDLNFSRDNANPKPTVNCVVSLNEAVFEHEQGEMILLAAALILIRILRNYQWLMDNPNEIF
jgi:hypothetical protein